MDLAVIARVSSQWSVDGLFDADWANLVGQWAVNHYRKYGAPVGNRIRVIYDSWSEETVVDEETVRAVEKFLLACSDDWDREDEEGSQFYIDLAGKVFNKVRLEREIDAAKAELSSGRVEEAQDRLSRVRRVELGVGSFLEPVSDPGLWEAAMDDRRIRSLVSYRGDAADFFDGAFGRREFYAFMAPDKTGKTSWLIDLCFRALRSRSRVLFVDTGDGSEDEVLRSLGIRSSEKPRFSGIYDFPVGWKESGNEKIVDTDLRRFEAVNLVDAYRSFRSYVRNEKAFRLMAFPNSTLSLDDLSGMLSDWSSGDQDWRPDVIVIDYADLLAPPKGFRDVNEQIDENWKQMRRISQERDCLLVTATQSNAAAYSDGKKTVLGRKHFSGRKTKLAHVNGMIGINVTDEERREGVSRLNWIVRRRWGKNQSHRNRILEVAGFHDACNPIEISRWYGKSEGSSSDDD